MLRLKQRYRCFHPPHLDVQVLHTVHLEGRGRILPAAVPELGLAEEGLRGGLHTDNDGSRETAVDGVQSAAVLRRPPDRGQVAVSCQCRVGHASAFRCCPSPSSAITCLGHIAAPVFVQNTVAPRAQDEELRQCHESLPLMLSLSAASSATTAAAASGASLSAQPPLVQLPLSHCLGLLLHLPTQTWLSWRRCQRLC